MVAAFIIISLVSGISLFKEIWVKYKMRNVNYTYYL
jgi:hypothetical protein